MCLGAWGELQRVESTGEFRRLMRSQSVSIKENRLSTWTTPSLTKAALTGGCQSGLD
ncbi:hypothetical protein [Laspinema olomoucense]|uniref:hypothetical protein n=1 Tax=Laspinema olomoucense TaxID=3231600 RepID=UPI0021BA4D17|nr:hypothetical protein [Laspinema sp. D3d]